MACSQILHNWKKKEIPSFSNNQKCCPLIAENRREKEKPSDLSTWIGFWLTTETAGTFIVFEISSGNEDMKRYSPSSSVTSNLRVAIHLRRGELFHGKRQDKRPWNEKKNNNNKKTRFFFNFAHRVFLLLLLLLLLEREKETPPKVFHTAWPVFHFLIFKKKERKKEIN